MTDAQLLWMSNLGMTFRNIAYPGSLARAEEKFVPLQSNVISLPRFSHFLKENSTL